MDMRAVGHSRFLSSVVTDSSLFVSEQNDANITGNISQQLFLNG